MTTAPDAHELRLSLTLDAPRAKVWRCWTEPDLLKQCFCPPPWTTPEAELDIRPGGAQRIVMAGPDGARNEIRAVYLEVIPGRRLVVSSTFSAAWTPAAGSDLPLLTIYEFDDAPGGGTRYRATVRHWSAEDRDRHAAMGFEAGWTACARQVEAVAAGLPEQGAFIGSEKVRTCLWFEQGGAEAARFYAGLLPGGAVAFESAAEPGQEPMIIEFSIGDAPYMILNGGPHYKPTPAASISVLAKDQAETDRLTAALIEGGGEQGRCGWCVDRFGVSWQIVPEALPRLLNAPDRAAAARVMSAMRAMTKFDIAALEAAFTGG